MASDERIGVVTDYLDRIGVAVIHLTDGDLHVGDRVRIAGRATEVTQAVESLEIEHQPVGRACGGSRGGDRKKQEEGEASSWGS